MYAELPQPLASGEYGIPPASVVPIFQGRPIVGGGNRPPQPAQPLPQTAIFPDNTPSRTLTRGVNPNGMPLVTAPVVSSLPFTGDVPRLPEIQMSPSVRGVASQPSLGFANSRLPISPSPIMRSLESSPAFGNSATPMQAMAPLILAAAAAASPQKADVGQHNRMEPGQGRPRAMPKHLQDFEVTLPTKIPQPRR